ncbi:hypothetical protein [Clostridium psychrophilum]|uniref:hypothetical protein n=1 Tax=Clostridium psychrophilum TaxID=132926 RepID=UPI001C0E801F|nr:hypothetical protein [Clostridium psychrophilum]MBU3179577.1 hypothetical protein [Clostridium psychrophilum]
MSNHLYRVEEVLIQEEMQRAKDYANSINVVKKEHRAEELVTNSMYGIIKGVRTIIIGKITEAKEILAVNKIEKDVLPPTRDELFSI